jgi:hypothetical protein
MHCRVSFEKPLKKQYYYYSTFSWVFCVKYKIYSIFLYWHKEKIAIRIDWNVRQLGFLFCLQFLGYWLF